MEMTKENVLRQMEQIHDEIKQHSFRITFSTSDIAEYKHLLYELSEVWCDLIWNCHHETEEEKKLYRQFGYWIHDYRQELRTYSRDTFPMQFFPYYEQMLQVTHNYLNTGNMDVFYNLDCFFTESGERKIKSEKYELITKEKCGIDSPELPHYFPVGNKLCVNDDKMKEYFLTRFHYPEKSEEERLANFETWKRDLKPVLEWINTNLVKDALKHKPWKSV